VPQKKDCIRDGISGLEAVGGLVGDGSSGWIIDGLAGPDGLGTNMTGVGFATLSSGVGLFSPSSIPILTTAVVPSPSIPPSLPK